MNRTLQHILDHVPTTPASTAKIHAAAYPGQTGNILREQRRATYRHLLHLSITRHITRHRVDDRHTNWSRNP